MVVPKTGECTKSESSTRKGESRHDNAWWKTARAKSKQSVSKNAWEKQADSIRIANLTVGNNRQKGREE